MKVFLCLASCRSFLSAAFIIGCVPSLLFFFFFFNDTATTEIYTLSLHDALPILGCPAAEVRTRGRRRGRVRDAGLDRKSTRLNSSHVEISYAVFCLKKKKKKTKKQSRRTIQRSTKTRDATPQTVPTRLTAPRPTP